jgi:hypothetical protein
VNTGIVVESEPEAASSGSYEYAYSRKRSAILGGGAVFAGLAVAVLFAILENMHFPMVWIDAWTALFATIVVVHAGILVVRKLLKSKYIDESEKIETDTAEERYSITAK